jgi:hypothetical protein
MIIFDILIITTQFQKAKLNSLTDFNIGKIQYVQADLTLNLRYINIIKLMLI